jgi:hypothetical protein
MKYWTFDVTSLISDFSKNQRTLASIIEALDYSRRLLKNPIGEETEGEVAKYIELLEMREAEYRLYTDMVILGLNELPEVERNVLKWWLIDHWSDEKIMDAIGTRSMRELAKIKNISLVKFHDIVMP